MKIRPLASFSDFVVEKMPELLESRPEEVARRCTEFGIFWSGGAWAALSTGIETDVDIDLALLDLKMVEAGIVHSGLTAPTQLVSLIDNSVGGGLAGLTYEDLVLVNPTDDMRTFTRGEVGDTERRFYRMHREIEGHLECAIKKIRRAMSCLPTVAPGSGADYWYVESAIRALRGIEDDLAPVITATAGLKQMLPEHFTAFRKYLNSHPVRGLKGPSGAFTAAVPTLELLLRGDELPAEYFKYLEGSMRYFSREGRKAISEALHLLPHNTLVSLWHKEGENPILRSRIDVVGTFLNDFRASHYRTVAHQIPEAIRGEISGTGGEANPGVFLRERIKMTRFPKEETK